MDDDFPVSRHDIQLRRDLVAQGWRDRDIARAVGRGDLTKVRYGAYVSSELVAGLDEVGVMRVRSRAVLRTTHELTLLSHQSALAEWGVPLWGLDLNQIHVTRRDRKAGRREAGIVHHRAALTDEQWTEHRGIPIVQPARAAIEVILATRPEVGLVAACGVLSRGLATHADLLATATRAERWPNSLHARIVLTRADARLTSVAEARTWHLVHEHRITRPEMQVEVHDAQGALLGIVDFLWRGHGVFLEFDGKIKYQHHRRPGETLDAYLMREKRREEQICAATGWVCMRIGWADLERPVNTARRIRRLLDSRARPAG